jgi:hypothetical protein
LLKSFFSAWRNIIFPFDQNKGVHAIFVSKKMLERDPEFEKSLLEKAKKQQDLVVMSYGSNKKTQVLYEPKAENEQ